MRFKQKLNADYIKSSLSPFEFISMNCLIAGHKNPELLIKKVWGRCFALGSKSIQTIVQKNNCAPWLKRKLPR